MMTTESSKVRSASGAGTLLGAASVAVLAAGVVTALAAALSGAGSAGAAATGAGVVLLVLGFGAFTVDFVAGHLPGASLLVALLTYTLQLVMMLVVLAAVADSGVFAAEVEGRWLGAGAIVVTLVWTLTQVRLTARRRIPLYDLPPSGARAGER